MDSTTATMPDKVTAEPTRAEQVAERKQLAAAYLSILHTPGSVFEIRALGISDFDNTYAGYFDNPDTAAAAIVDCDLRMRPRGIYVTINPVKPELLARINNRLVKVKRGETSSDVHVIGRHWLFIDIDPERPVKGIPATDIEQAKAIERAAQIREWLMTEFGWHEPLEVDSGNGHYLLFPIDLPNDKESAAASTLLVKRVLEAIGAKWSDADVKIDATVSNAARIARVLGTVNRKGDPLPDRPHRLCRSLVGPDYLADGWSEPIPREKLDAVASLAPADEPKPKAKSKAKRQRSESVAENVPADNGDASFDHVLKVEEYLEARDVEFRPPHTLADGRTCWQAVCPFNPDHGFDFAVFQSPDGKLGAHCHHDSCSGKGWQDAKEAWGKPDAEHYDPPLPEGLYVGRPQNQTDIANAQRLVNRFGSKLRYVPAFGLYLWWEAIRWAEDTGNVNSMQCAKTVIRDDVWPEILNCMSDETVKFGKRAASHSGLRAMLSTAAPDLAIPHSALDKNPWLLNCRNGTVDLKTGQLRPHDPADLLTKLCPIDFDPNARCPRWEQFLDEVFVSPALVAFIARLVGYFLTGDVTEQMLAIFWGDGSNGKSTFLTILQAMLGDYASQAPAALLAVKKQEQHPAEIAALFGVRLAVATESDNAARLDEARVKALTGGDLITARRMRENFWTFAPTHKLVLCTNHRPKVRGTDHGIWRRIRLVPFAVKFDGAAKDKTLYAKLLTELPGILAWAVRGCLEWQREGLKPPQEVMSATEEYRSHEDIVGRFVVDCCLVGSSSFTCKFSDLYSALEDWCEDGGDYLPSRKAVSQWLTENGFESFHSGVRRFRGVGIRNDRNDWNPIPTSTDIH